MSSRRNTKPRYLMAAYIDVKIRESGKTQAEIASECGFTRPNVVSMIKLGHIRLPLDRLAAFAKAIDVDVFDLFCWWMRDFYGKTWLDLEQHIARAPAGLSTIIPAGVSLPSTPRRAA